MELQVTHSFDLKSNMEEVKASIAETIAKYDVVVVEDRLGEAKELMATFNKDKKAFSDKCKEFLKIIGAPIDEFKAQQKEIEKMYDEGRQKIADQVAKFEAGKLEIIGTLVRAYRNMQCETRSINIEAVQVNDLVMLSAVSSTKSGYSLTKKITDAIDQRIQAVENEILKARLEAEEKAKRDREIAEQAKAEAEEKARQREAELIAKHEREKAELMAKPERVEDQPKTQEVPNVEEHQPDPVVTDDGKRVFVITATFEVLAPSQTPLSKIETALRKKMDDAGITSLKSIKVM